MKNPLRNNFMWVALLAIPIVYLIYIASGTPDGNRVTFSEFEQLIADGEVQSVIVKGQEISGKQMSGAPFSTIGPDEQGAILKTLESAKSPVPVEIQEEDDYSWLSVVLSVILPLVVMVLLFMFVMRSIQGSNGRAMNFGKSKARMHNENSRRVTFDDVAGIEESKEELEEIVEFLKEPTKFTRLGGRIPKGVLLMGPPGTGKTLLARAVAGEAGVPFFSISGSDFVEMFVGVGASRVRDLFEQGRKHSPCIIFIDEIDAVGRHRGTGLGGGHDEREQTLNQLLVEMDGFEGTEAVILVAATNRPDVLDPALLRPGRFDRRITVPAPDVAGREKILQIHTRRLPLGEDVKLSVLARRTPGFSGADLENLCNEAALLAARKDKRQVDAADFDNAVEKIYMGPERRSLVMSEREKKTTAYHEAGHAIVGHFMPEYAPLHKVTIVPRGRALGVTMHLSPEDRLSMSRADMLNRIAMAMGGRAAEEIAFEHYTTGAQNDLQQATNIARHMVTEYGMSADLGPVAWGGSDNEPFLGRSMAQPKSYSEETARRIDTEVKSICQDAYDVARNILEVNLHILHKVSEELLEKESLSGEEFKALVEASGPVQPSTISAFLRREVTVAQAK